MQQIAAHVGLAVELRGIELDEASAYPHRHQGTGQRIADRDAEQRRADRPQHAGEGEDRQQAVEHHQNEGQGRAGEGSHVLRDALIGMLHRMREFDVLISAVAEVASQRLARQPQAPQQDQAFLAEADEGADHRREREQADHQHSLEQEAAHLLLFDCGHEVATSIADEDIETVHRDQQHRDHEEIQARPSTALGAQEVGQLPSGMAHDGALAHGRCIRRMVGGMPRWTSAWQLGVRDWGGWVRHRLAWLLQFQPKQFSERSLMRPTSRSKKQETNRLG